MPLYGETIVPFEAISHATQFISPPAVKLIAATPFPTTTLDPAPDTVHEEPDVAVVLLQIINVFPAVVKLGGFVPDPFAFIPHVLVEDKEPEAAE